MPGNHNLPYQDPYFFLLESSLSGRYTIAASKPKAVLTCTDPNENFFATLRRHLQETPRTENADLPFTGGWIGYLGYELYSCLEAKVPPRAARFIPRAVFCYYDSASVFEGRLEAPPDFSQGASGPLNVTSNFSKKDYLEAVRETKDYISAGDCYQVNLSQKFEAKISQPSTLIYQHLRSISPSPYSAYLNLGDAQILSSSPESFLKVDGRRVITRPIKGTRPRGLDAREDARLRAELASSAKDRAELLMITDLERNDLGRVCRPGSIRVRELAAVETFPQVHHLMSTIEGQLDDGKDVVDLLQAAFPGGSITGAPKVRAMQIIRELEPHAREVYCGAIGYISSNGRAEFNVAIRTMVVKDGTAHFWSGGGIVADSEPEKEYEETLVKAKGMIAALS